jgi:hypothetical protein
MALAGWGLNVNGSCAILASVLLSLLSDGINLFLAGYTKFGDAMAHNSSILLVAAGCSMLHGPTIVERIAIKRASLHQ